MDSHQTPLNKRILLPKEFDPRSPTTDFNRTPIMVEVDNCSTHSSSSGQNTPFKSVLETSEDNSFFDHNMSRDDPSPVVSSLSIDSTTAMTSHMEVDGEQDIFIQNTTSNSSTESTSSSNTNHNSDIETNRSFESDISFKTPIEEDSFKSPVEEIFKTPIDIVFQPPVEEMEKSLVEQMEQTPSKNSDIKKIDSTVEKVQTSTPEIVSKKIIFSPSMNILSPRTTPMNTSFTFHMDENASVDSNKSYSSPQVTAKGLSPRTPLASLQQQSNSPLNILRAKQWKDFNQEREKLGLHDTENVLPPFKTAPSSVPAKKPIRRRPLI